MKLIFVAFAALLCGASAYPSVFDGPQCQSPNGGGLMSTIKEVVALVPVDKVVEIYLVAVSNDPEVQEVMEYIQSDKFVKLVTAVHAHPHYQGLIKFTCDELFVDAKYFLDILHDYLGWPKNTNAAMINNLATPGFIGMLKDILDVIPTDKIVALMKEKIESDEYVKKGLEMLRSDEFKTIVKTVTNMPEYKEVENGLREKGAPVDKIIEFLQKFFGWA